MVPVNIVSVPVSQFLFLGFLLTYIGQDLTYRGLVGSGDWDFGLTIYCPYCPTSFGSSLFCFI